MLDRGAHGRLDEEQQGDDEEEPGRGPLGLRDPHRPGLEELQGGRVVALPAELAAPSTVDGEQQAEPDQQGDQGDRGPHEDVGGGVVIHPLLGRPVVGVGIAEARPLRGARPCRPGVEGGEVVDVLRVGDRLGDEPVRGGRVAEELPVVALQLLEGADLLVGEDERAGVLVEAVGALHLRGGLARVLDALLLQLLADVLGAQAQVLGGVVGAQVGAVPEDGAVLLDPAGQEDVLPAGDVLPGVDDLAVLADDLLRQRHRMGVGAIREHPHHEEAEDQHQCDALDPPLGQGDLRSRPMPGVLVEDAHAHAPVLLCSVASADRSPAARDDGHIPSGTTTCWSASSPTGAAQRTHGAAHSHDGRQSSADRLVGAGRRRGQGTSVRAVRTRSRAGSGAWQRRR